MGSQQLFCLRWSNHQTNMLNVFDQLLQSEALVDVTLACEGLSLRAHKVVLSACSPYFQHLFIENPCKHPIVILKDIKYTDLKALVDFMYKGEVNVTQEQLSALLKTAETLKVKGLAEMTGGSPGAATQHATANSIPPVPTHSGSSIPPHPVLPQLPRSPSPPNKRKKVRQRRPSSEQTPSSDLDDTDSLEIRGSPEVIETKVEVPSEAFGPERSADQDSRPEHTSDMKMDVTPNSSEDNAVVYQSPVHAVANNSTSLVQPTTANTPPSTLLPPPPLLPSTLPSTSGSQPTSQAPAVGQHDGHGDDEVRESHSEALLFEAIKLGTRRYEPLHAAPSMFQLGCPIVPTIHSMDAGSPQPNTNNSGGSGTPKRGQPRILNEEEENQIVSYILEMAARGKPVTRKCVLEYGNMLLRRQDRVPTGSIHCNPEKGLSNDWWKEFKKRHPGLPFRAVPSSS